MGFGLIETLVGFVLWATANAVYFDMKRKGTRGFRRFLAFWFGTPTTWFTFFMVPEEKVPQIEPPADDEAGLLAEIRRDRARRIVSGTERASEQPEEPMEEK